MSLSTLDPLTEKIKNMIRDWMSDRDLYKNDDVINKNVTFQLNGISKVGISFSIIQPIALKRTVIVVSRIDIVASHYEALKDMPATERDEFLFNLKRDLIFQSPDFTFEPAVPKSIQFSKEIMFDELTEGKIREVVERITRCVLWVAWCMGKRFGPPSERKK
jgi:hypothetical protein